MYKPYGMLSQFTAEEGKQGLGALHDFPKTVYPVGRLDEDSEGLILLTDDKRLTNALLDPDNEKTKTYWCEVENIPDENALRKLEQGFEINLKGTKHKTKPAKANVLLEKPDVPPRSVPVNYTKAPQHCWLELQITEGKNRQVRKMTAAVGHPTLRLIRVAIENLKLESFEPGWVKRLGGNELYRMLNIRR